MFEQGILKVTCCIVFHDWEYIKGSKIHLHLSIDQQYIDIWLWQRDPLP